MVLAELAELMALVEQVEQVGLAVAKLEPNWFGWQLSFV